LDGANRAVLYGIVLALVTLRRWPVRDHTLAVGLVAAGIGAIAVGVLVECALRAHPADLFIDARLIEPVGYTNATASLWLIGFWPALALACRRRLHWASRSVLLGLACVLLETSLLSVSRGAVASIAVTAVVLLAAADARWKVAFGLVAVGGAAALAAGPVLEVSASSTVAELERALPPALAAIAWTSALVACLGAAAIALGRRAETAMAPAARLAARIRVERLMALLAAVAVVVVLVGIGNPATWAGDRWHDFKTSGYTAVKAGPGRLTGSLGSGRYDFYRVALDEFRERPLAGAGYESFQVAYLAQRRTDETPRFPHSLAFGVLSQLGVVGAALFLAFLVQALAMVRRALRDAGDERLLVAGALAGFTVWFVHGLVDWLWEFPALGILAFSLLGLAMRGCAATEQPEIPGQPPCRRLLEWPFARRRVIRARAVHGAAAVAAVVAALSFATLGIASRLTQAGFDSASRDPSLALTQLERASRLDVLSAAPLLTRGVIAQRLGNRPLAEASFRDALAREPRNWFANLELGIASARAGKRDAALELLARAARLNPREALIAQARRRVARGEAVMPGEIERALFTDQRERVKSVMP
jgi:O-antigen ligase